MAKKKTKPTSNEALTLSSLRKKINDKYKRDIISSNRSRSIKKIERLSTGSFWLDYACGGGIPMHRFITLWGDESSGKTTSALKILSDAQNRNFEDLSYVDSEVFESDVFEYDDDRGLYVQKKSGEIIQPLRCAMVDLEGTYDAIWHRALGGIPENLEIIQPDFGEQAVDIIEGLISSKLFHVILVDSLAVMTPLAEVEASANDQHMGIQARMLNKACRKWTMAMNNISDNRDRPTVIMINQKREKIGVMFGNPETVPGGKGVKFLTSLEIKNTGGRKVATLDEHGRIPLWVEMKGIINKNKTAAPKIEFEYKLALNDYDPEDYPEQKPKYNIAFKKGDILEHSEVIKEATRVGMVGKNGNKYFIKLSENQMRDDDVYEYDKKGDLLDVWFYKDKFNYNRAKQSLLDVLTGKS